MFWVSTHEHFMAFSRRKKCILLASLNVILSSIPVLVQMQSIILLQLYLQHKQQVVFLHILAIEENATENTETELNVYGIISHRWSYVGRLRKKSLQPGTEKLRMLILIFHPAVLKTCGMGLSERFIAFTEIIIFVQFTLIVPNTLLRWSLIPN